MECKGTFETCVSFRAPLCLITGIQSRAVSMLMGTPTNATTRLSVTSTCYALKSLKELISNIPQIRTAESFGETPWRE
jgi:hypothetical protein